MKHFFFIITILTGQACFSQYTIDSSLPTKYGIVYERLPEVVKKEREKHFKYGLGLLISIKTDTLNKNDLLGGDHPDKNQATDPETVTRNSKAYSPGEKDSAGEMKPTWISCICRFKGDTLVIINGITNFSGFDLTTSLFKDKAKAIYTEYESETVLKTHLANERVTEISIPATINNLVLDRIPKKGIREIYGKMTATSNGYFSYLNAGNFKNGYVHKRLKLHYYFRCDISN